MPPNRNSTVFPKEPVDSDGNEVTTIEPVMKKPLRWNEFETKIKWVNATFLVLFHCVCLYFVLTFPYRKHPYLFFWAWFFGELAALGVTAGAHRLWAHRTYKAKLPLRIFLAICYCCSGMNKMFNWVRDHRVHHKYTDTEADPHDSNRGFWFSHVGWLMLKKKPAVVECGKGVDMTDILEDPVIQFVDKYFIILSPLCAIILPVFIPVYFFNQSLKYTFISQVFMRYPWILNAAWSVNSFAHIFGYHSYDKSINPTENAWVAFFSFGEGWHNYHHVFPWDYKTAEFKGFFLNPASLWIDFFAKIGWAYDLKRVTPDHIKKIIERKGDGTHLIHPMNNKK